MNTPLAPGDGIVSNPAVLLWEIISLLPDAGSGSLTKCSLTSNLRLMDQVFCTEE